MMRSGLIDTGDVVQTLDACDELEVLLSRLKRQHVVTEQDVYRCRENVDRIRTVLQGYLSQSALTPRGPRL